MIEEAIVLAGGMGTRLRNVIKDVPKPLAPVGGKPFLNYILDFLCENKIKRVILSVGYKKELIIKTYGNDYKNIQILYSEETIPLGTGGAIKASFNLIKGNKAYVLNGDTLFTIDLKKLYKFHIKKHSTLSVALKAVEKCERYGSVQIDNEQRISGFKEKGTEGRCLINGGYIL